MQVKPALKPVDEDVKGLKPVDFRAQTFKRVMTYLLSRFAMIAFTIFAGVFITILIVSKSGQLERNARAQVDRYINQVRYNQSFSSSQEELDYISALRAELIEESGLNLPFWLRQAKWTIDALRLDWGRAMSSSSNSVFSMVKSNVTVREIILRYMPNTVLLAGVSNLLVFVLGIPLALYLSNHYGSFLDRIFSILVPLSSIPSWVHAVLLISVFAVELRILPLGGMLDTRPPDTSLGYVPIVFRHIILPVAAIFFSMFFQLVYSWRTYFLIFSQEDYVELGRAKGLPSTAIDRHYILQPSLSYVITGFALNLVSFWQTMMVLEVVFDWPGIGWLYIKKALPNYWGESMYQGELIIAIGIVVIFAYLLGAVVFALDLVYAWVDPRIRLADTSITSRLKQRKTRFSLFSNTRSQDAVLFPKVRSEKTDFRKTVFVGWQGLISFAKSLLPGGKAAWRELKGSPLALSGLLIIAILITASIYAVVALPYEKIGGHWASETLVGRSDVPRLARPAWLNLFRQQKELSVLVLRSQDPVVLRSEQQFENGTRIITYDFSFDYPYSKAPDELNLYLDADYIEKRPFVYLVWTTPDGRQFDLRGTSVAAPRTYNFEEYIPYKKIVQDNPNLGKWFLLGKVNPTPAHYLLFHDPARPEPFLIQGTYHLRVSGMFFEEKGDLRAELVLLGQVYGLAGTDYLRRNLLVPLLWGLPFALLFGLLGAVVTTILSMIVAASGVWFGGWVDDLIQRLIEANMIMPVLAICVLVHWLFGISIWMILAVVVILNIFGSPTKTFRSAFMQLKDAPYIEAAEAYGASNQRIILHYLMPRIIPVLVPQLVTLIPSFVFLEATLGMFNIKSDYPTWGTVIYQALVKGALWGSSYWVLEPLAMLLLTGLAFAMLGYALERILNPRLREKG